MCFSLIADRQCVACTEHRLSWLGSAAQGVALAAGHLHGFFGLAGSYVIAVESHYGLAGMMNGKHECYGLG